MITRRVGSAAQKTALLCALCAWAGRPTRAKADEPVLFGVEASATLPIASPQFDRFGLGGSLGLELLLPVTPYLAPVFRLRGTILSDGPAPSDPTLRDPGLGWVAGVGAGLRLRPQGFSDPTDFARATGFWIELDVNGVLTGEFVRPAFEAGVGWLFAADSVRLGPAVRFQHILHFDDPLDSSSAFLLSAGLEVVFFDRQGHPEPPPAPRGDRDGDGLFDDEDACPDEPEDFDGFEDQDGCPDPDNDRDGVLDPEDRCPVEPEDRDDFEDTDGCPELDNDRDGILDPQDSCPNEPEVVNGVNDTDGCPDEGLIAMVDDRIVLEERVLFDFERARVKHTAVPILEAIVELWRQHPEWFSVRIEGHADVRGTAAYNQQLSERRAAQVRTSLVELGMPESMFEVVGYGATRPRDTDDTEEAHQRNRRVEFVVVRHHAEQPSTSSDAPSGAGVGQ